MSHADRVFFDLKYGLVEQRQAIIRKGLSNGLNARQIASAALTFIVIGWLIWRGAEAMEYNWQWYRVEPFEDYPEGDLSFHRLTLATGPGKVIPD